MSKEKIRGHVCDISLENMMIHAQNHDALYKRSACAYTETLLKIIVKTIRNVVLQRTSRVHNVIKEKGETTNAKKNHKFIYIFQFDLSKIVTLIATFVNELLELMLHETHFH